MHHPSPGLASAVRRFVGYRYEGLEPGQHLGMPSTALTLVLPIDGKLDVSLGTGRGQYAATVAGLHLRPATIHYGRAQIGLQLAIDPLSCRRLLGVPAAELAGAAVDLADLLGPLAGRLLDSVHAESSLQSSCTAVDRLLNPGAEYGLRPEVTNAWRLILRSGGLVSVGELAYAVGWSRRHLELQFRRELGISPKQACRLRRFERAVRLVRDGGDLAEVAVRAGFTDQPHLYRDWREMTGTTPIRWRREEILAFVQDRARALAESGNHD